MSECSGPGCTHPDHKVVIDMADFHEPQRRPAVKKTPTAAELEWQIEELMELRRMAKDASRSGDPAIRAEAKRGIAECNEHLTAMRELFGRLYPHAQL